MANPCLENNGGCSNICTVMSNRRVCSCNPGFSLDFDGATCIGTEAPSFNATSFFPLVYICNIAQPK